MVRGLQSFLRPVAQCSVSVLPPTPPPSSPQRSRLGPGQSLTSMFPPTRASSGGSGLSFSLRSCLFDCRRPEGKGDTG